MDDAEETRSLKTPEGEISSREALIALQKVYNETEALYHQSSGIFEQIYGQGEVSMARRGLLTSLLRRGSQTVPQLARAKAVSRQYVQKLVNQLIDEGYVELVENIAHKRSHLVQLSQAGQTFITGMLRQEMKIVSAMVIDLPVDRLNETAEMLRSIREWQKRELDRILQDQAPE